MWKRIVGSLIQNMSPQLRNLDISFTINFLDTAALDDNKCSVITAVPKQYVSKHGSNCGADYDEREQAQGL